jgi:hypothetical protein
MPKPFYERLVDYYSAVGTVLRGEAAPASIFANSTDIGISRERVYMKFLKAHAPAKCDVRFGGFLFHENGSESGQMDMIVTTDTAARFDFDNQDGNGKSFSCVEGTVGAFCIKSYLGKAQLFDSLLNIASIPPTLPVEGRIPPKFHITDYADWPYKVIYASDGLTTETLRDHLVSFYVFHPHIPANRRPNMIHVAGRFVALRRKQDGWNPSIDVHDNMPPIGAFAWLNIEPDVQAMAWLFHHLQVIAEASTQLLLNSSSMLVHVSEELQRRAGREVAKPVD